MERKWTPVSEKTPTESDWYLVSSGLTVMIAWWHQTKHCWEVYNGEQLYLVEAWMKLPAPYAMVRKEN